MNKTNVVRILDRLQVAYEVRTYEVDEADLSAGHVADLVGLPADQVFKTLVARTDQREVVLACVPGALELDMKALGVAAGAKRVELVPLKEVQGLTGYIRGGVSPLGTRKDFRVFLDETAILWDEISISAGQRGMQILMAPDDLIRATNAVVCEIAKSPSVPL